MHAPTFVVALIGAAVSPAIAWPTVLSSRIEAHSNISDIGFGQQLQERDQTNHWVVWVEGKNPCKPFAILNSLADGPCNHTFVVPGTEDQLSFGNCDDENQPNELLRGGQFARNCKVKKHWSTWHCESEKVHDVVKHGKCKDN